MKILVIDFSNLLYRSYFAYPKLTQKNLKDNPQDQFQSQDQSQDQSQIHVGAFYGFAKNVIGLIKQLSPDHVFVAMDTPKPTFRHLKYPDYKAKRPKPDEQMISQIQPIKEWCKKVGFSILIKEGYEADDLIYTVVNNLNRPSSNNPTSSIFDQFDETDFEITKQELLKNQSPGVEYLILSNDKDLFQLLDKGGVSIIQTSKKLVKSSKQIQNVPLSKSFESSNYNSNKTGVTLFDGKDFKNKYGLCPSQWLDFKALVGDGSDNLKGLAGVGPKTAESFLRKVGSIANFCKFLDIKDDTFSHTVPYLTCDLQNFIEDIKNHNLIQNIKQNLDNLRLTYNLSKLVSVPRTELNLAKIDLQNGLLDFQTFGFKSLQQEVYSLTKEPVRSEILF